MNPKILIVISALFFSCHNQQAAKNKEALPSKDSGTNKTVIAAKPENQPLQVVADTASCDYLIYLLKNELALNSYWTQKLNVLDILTLPLDSMSRLSITHNWIINDSIMVIILSHSTGTNYDEFLLTVRNKKEVVAKIHISNQADSDLSAEHPYYYTEYKLINNRRVKLFKHKVVGVEGGDEKDKVLSIENWMILDNGKVQKK